MSYVDPIRAAHGGPNSVARREYLYRDTVRLAFLAYPALYEQSPHDHDFGSVTLVMRGDCREMSEHDNHVSQACTILVKPPHVSHSNAYGERGTSSLQIAFSPKAFPSFPIHDACQHFEGGAPAAKMLALLRATKQPRTDALVPLIKDAMNAIGGACQRKSRPQIDEWEQDLLHQIESAPSETVSVQSVADRIGMHPVSLARAFRRHHACSITEYLRRARILRASRRIAAGDSSLADLAIELGFADQPHFTRAFRAELGCTPGEFRRLVAS